MKTAQPFLTALLPMLGLLPGLAALDAQAQGSPQQNACMKQLGNKCFHTSHFAFNPALIQSPTDAAAFCASQQNYCSSQECVARVEVLAGLVPGQTKGNPCLPAGSSPSKKGS